MLAALAVVVSGATMSAGVAGGAAPDEGFSGSLAAAWFGSTGGCAGLTEALCDGFFTESATAGDISLGYKGPATAEVDSEVTFKSVFTARDAMPGKAVTSVTHHAPRGFEFVGAEVSSRHQGVWPPTEPDLTTELDSTVVVDPATGNGTVTAPAGGWVIPTRATDTVSGYVIVELRYKVIKSYLDGTSGITFTGTDVPASEGWLATGATRVTPGIGWFGSSGN
ncbi:hypothetical protein ACWFRB_04790 [Rhodococcus sp. NPDC055112]